MSKLEILFIKIFLWILIPGLFFLLLWWTSAFLAIYKVYSISENQIALFSISGLVIGLCLMFFTRNFFLTRFYSIGYQLLIPIYLIYSAISFGIMMGFPLGNIVLGMIAGFYVGRRLKHAQLEPASYLMKASLFTAVISGFWASIITILAFRDGQVLLFLESKMGLMEEIVRGPIGIVLIVLIFLIVGISQFYLTRFTFKLSFKI